MAEVLAVLGFLLFVVGFLVTFLVGAVESWPEWTRWTSALAVVGVGMVALGLLGIEMGAGRG